jgi:hypothetical protein
MSNNKEMWLTVNDMGIWHMEHEGDYDREDTILHITTDVTGNPTIRVIKPQ